MSRIMNVGLHPLRVGKFSTLVRPKNLVLLGGLFLFAVGILIFGLMHGSFSVPASEVGRALFAPENVILCRIFACRESSWHCYAEPC